MHTDKKRFYEALGVAPTVSDKAIRVAFRRRAKLLHPDAPTGDAAAFIRLKQAYDVLSDRGLRADYDRSCRPLPDVGHRRTGPAPAMPFAAARPPRRRGGIGLARYAVAFVVVAAISLGGVEAMISFTEAPPSIRARPTASVGTAGATPEPAAADSSPAPGSSKSGFWDPSPEPPAKRN